MKKITQWSRNVHVFPKSPGPNSPQPHPHLVFLTRLLNSILGRCTSNYSASLKFYIKFLLRWLSSRDLACRHVPVHTWPRAKERNSVAMGLSPWPFRVDLGVDPWGTPFIIWCLYHINTGFTPACVCIRHSPDRISSTLDGERYWGKFIQWCPTRVLSCQGQWQWGVSRVGL